MPAKATLALLRASVALSARQRVSDYALYPQRQPAMPEWRDKIVTWMQLLGTEFRFSSACIEAAASYFDRLMSAVRVDRSQLQTAALACVLIATKQHETGGQALTFKLVRERMASITTTEALAKMEIEVLFALKWDANAFTAVQFVQCVTSFIVTPHAARDVCTTAEHFLQTALKQYSFLRFSSCEIGLAAVAASCIVRSFLYDGLVESLRLHGVHVELHMELVETFSDWHAVELRDRQRCELSAPSPASTVTLDSGVSAGGSLRTSSFSDSCSSELDEQPSVGSSAIDARTPAMRHHAQRRRYETPDVSLDGDDAFPGPVPLLSPTLQANSEDMDEVT